jgi:hypothetical protein
MTARLRCSTRRRAALLVAFASLSGCGQNEGPGKGAFSYVCPAPVAADPLAPSLDAACGPHGDSLASIPEVAVSAPFSLQYSEPTTGAPRPAVASRAMSTSQGWSLIQPGWLGFIAWSGSDVVDFTHVHAETVATLRLEPDVTAPLSVGTTIHVAATPLDAAGAVLGGAIPCTFVSLNPAVVSVAGAGRVARAFAKAAGEATLSAACLGTGAQVTVQVAGPQPAAGH